MTTLHQSLSASLRNEALEEAAKVCERHMNDSVLAAWEDALESAAQAIRSLKTEQ